MKIHNCPGCFEGTDGTNKHTKVTHKMKYINEIYYLCSNHLSGYTNASSFSVSPLTNGERKEVENASL